jgi:hypothetical protein
MPTFACIVSSQWPQAVIGNSEEERQDCRPFFLKDNQLFIQSTAGVIWGSVPTTRVEELVFAARGTRSLSHLMVDADYGGIEHPTTIEMVDVAPAGEPWRRGMLAGKNHMFFEANDTLHALNKFFPPEVWAFEDNRTARKLASIRQPELEGMEKMKLNGGKLLDLPETRELLGIIHIHHGFKTRASYWNSHYTQAFFTMNREPPFRVLRLSNEFCIASATRPDVCDSIQFVMSIEREGDQLILPYGRNDVEAMVLTIPFEKLDSMLQPL